MRTTNRRLLVAVVFALSCFALFLFLWTSFGGPTPLSPEGYRLAFYSTETTGLADQADVRISGVDVGKVVGIEREDSRTRVVVEIDSEFSPRPADTRATLRLKTLLGENYVELTPGSGAADPLPEGAELPASQVATTVQLDEILRAFDGRTRSALRRAFASFASATTGRAEDISGAVAGLGGAARATGGVLAVLDRHREATQALVRDAGVVFGAAGRDAGAVRRLITSSEQALEAIAARDERLAETLRILPTFLRELRPTMADLEVTSDLLDPVVRELAPISRTLRPTLDDVVAASPDLRETLRALEPLAAASRAGLPAAQTIAAEARPLMGELDPLMARLIPILEYAWKNRFELLLSWGKTAAVPQLRLPALPDGKPLSVLRLLATVGPESLTGYGSRFPGNRTNPYGAPRRLEELPTGLKSFSCAHVNAVGEALNVPCVADEPQAFGGKRRLFPHLRPRPPGG
jgi:virulence factor Mce-like protein